MITGNSQQEAPPAPSEVTTVVPANLSSQVSNTSLVSHASTSSGLPNQFSNTSLLSQTSNYSSFPLSNQPSSVSLPSQSSYSGFPLSTQLSSVSLPSQISSSGSGSGSGSGNGSGDSKDSAQNNVSLEEITRFIRFAVFIIIHEYSFLLPFV